MAHGKKLFAALPLLTSAEKSGQRRRLTTKTIVQQREAEISEVPSLSLSYNLPALGALREKFSRSVISFASLRYVWLATKISAKNFR